MYTQCIYYTFKFFIELLIEALKSCMKHINLRCLIKPIIDSKGKNEYRDSM